MTLTASWARHLCRRPLPLLATLVLATSPNLLHGQAPAFGFGFDETGRNMWGLGSASTYSSLPLFLGATWGSSSTSIGGITGGRSCDPTGLICVPTYFGLEATLAAGPGRLGLLASGMVTGGSLNYAFDGSARTTTASTNATVGGVSIPTVAFGTSITTANKSFSSVSPSLAGSLALAFKASANVWTEACFFDCSSSTWLNLAVDETIPLVDFNPAGSGRLRLFDLFDVPYVSTTMQGVRFTPKAPFLSLSGTPDGAGGLAASGSTSALDITLSLNSLVGSPNPLKNTIAGFGYTLLDAGLVGEIGFSQYLGFQPNVRTTVTFDQPVQMIRRDSVGYETVFSYYEAGPTLQGSVDGWACQYWPTTDPVTGVVCEPEVCWDTGFSFDDCYYRYLTPIFVNRPIYQDFLGDMVTQVTYDAWETPRVILPQGIGGVGITTNYVFGAALRNATYVNLAADIFLTFGEVNVPVLGGFCIYCTRVELANRNLTPALFQEDWFVDYGRTPGNRYLLAGGGSLSLAPEDDITVTPEPGVLVLLATGLVLLMVMGRRRGLPGSREEQASGDSV